MKTEAIIALNASPRGLAGSCPKCQAPIHNPAPQERIGLSMTLRWKVACGGCGASVTVQNPRFLPKGGI